MRWKEIIESATVGATGAASIAATPTALGGIGVGFNPDGDKGIYQKTKRKPILIRRMSPASIQRDK